MIFAFRGLHNLSLVEHILGKDLTYTCYKLVHYIPGEDLLPQRIHTGSLHEDKAYLFNSR